MTMNPTPDHLDDETLSALLDGHAADRPDAAAHLGACDRCAGRQAELGAAGAALAAATVEPLDELTRRRLVAGSLQAVEETPASLARSRWAQRHPALIGSAAAVLLAVLVGVPFVVGNGGGSQHADTSLAAQAPNAAREESASPFLGDLGDLTDRDRLRLRLSGGGENASLNSGPAEPVPSLAPVSGGRTSSPAAKAATPSTTLGFRSGGGAGFSGEAQSTAGPPAADAANETFASDQAAGRDRTDTDACVAALLNGPARGGRLTGAGTGTWRGRPAIVAAFELSGGTVAFVADRAGCAVLDRFTL